MNCHSAKKCTISTDFLRECSTIQSARLSELWTPCKWHIHHNVAAIIRLHITQWRITSSPSAGVQSIAMSVSVCLPLTYLENHTSWNFLYVKCGRGSVLPWWQRKTLCTSGFVDDVMFSHNRPGKGDANTQSILKVINQGHHRGEVWCLRLPCSI